jgi:membrane-associated phospholipid phosphatase
MGASDYLINLLLSVMLITGVYQFYFWCQRNPLVAPRELGLFIDERIPYWPAWVWIYSGIYYPLILYLNLVLDSPRQFTHVAASYLLLLSAQMAFFVLFPVHTPAHWRAFNRRRTLSERLLALVQRFDARSNSFPSMHVSVATLTALHLHGHFGPAAFAFPVLVGLSCLFTKQHYLIDLPPGAVLGWTVYRLYCLCT